MSNYFNQNGWSSLWGLIDGGISGLLGALLIIVAFIIFPLSYTLFTLFYALYGTVLYVVGPFVLALLPARGFGQLARTYLLNLMVFGAWGLIYAILQALMTAVNMGSLNAVLNANGILNSFFGLGPSDSPGSGEHRVFDCHSLHSVYCQPNRAGRGGQHHAGHGGDGRQVQRSWP